MGVPFRFISYEELANGILEKSEFKLLILPDSGAMSDQEVAAVSKFFAQGGCVLAEGIPARRYENCKLRKTPALKEIFRRSRGQSVLINPADTDYVLLSAAPDSKLNRKQILFEQNQFSALLKRLKSKSVRSKF